MLSPQHERPIEELPVPRRKGKHASSTENRRMVWENVVWPLVLEINRSYFTLREYHAKRDAFCKENIITRDKNIYSINYRLIPYMRKKVPLEYGLVIREVNTIR